jgi:hypothetical protein
MLPMPRSHPAPPGPPATLGGTARSGHSLIVVCKACRRQVEFTPVAVAQLAEKHGAELTLLDWRDRLKCSECDCREIEMVVGRGGPQRGID